MRQEAQEYKYKLSSETNSVYKRIKEDSTCPIIRYFFSRYACVFEPQLPNHGSIK